MEQLKQRLRWFDPDNAEHMALLHEEQPEGGTVDGHPAVQMRNSVIWFWNKDARPTRDGAPIKTKAPTGWRKLLCDDPSKDELLLVEGEGHGMAAVSVGHRGVVVAGGVNNLMGDSEAAVKDRMLLFKDKRVRLLFDPDEAGEAARVRVAREVLAAGAAKVGLLELPGDGDLEDWLHEFDTSDAAYIALSNLCATVDWATDQKLDKAEKAAAKKARDAEESVQSIRLRVAGDHLPRLVVMTYERASGRASLAIYGPTSEPEVPQYGDVNWEGVTRGWQMASKWVHEGRTFLPDEASLGYLERGTLVLPPPPASEPWSSQELWHRTIAYMQKWVLTARDNYTRAASYVFMTWRLEDCRFDQLPYLRVYGPSGSGKGRMLDVLQQLLWRSFSTHPTDKNLHRIVDYFGDISLVVDEFHLEGARREASRELVDALCLGFDRAKGGVTRVVEHNGKQQPRHFNLFGPKVLAGYGVDEDEALARRTLTIEMLPTDEQLPESMNLLALPAEFYTEGEELRAQLLAWRARKLGEGAPDPRSARARELQRRAGNRVAQVFYPLVMLVPDLPEEVERLMLCAEQRNTDVTEVRHSSDTAHMVGALMQCTDAKSCVTFSEDGATTYYVTAADVADLLESPRDAAHIGRQLRQALGIVSQKRRINGQQGRYLELRSNDPNLALKVQRHGYTWPPEGVPQLDEDPGL